MKGKHLVIGLILFVIIIVAAIYFSMMATFNKDTNALDSVVISEYQALKTHSEL